MGSRIPRARTKSLFHGPEVVGTAQFDEIFVIGGAMKAWAVGQAEGLEVLQRAELFERQRSRDRIRRIEAAGAAWLELFTMLEVRRRVSSRKKRSEPRWPP